MSEPQTTRTPVIRFGVFELDVSAAELRKAGRRVRLQEQPLVVLTMLLERPGELVSRDDIRARLWPEGTFVDFERGLNSAIKRLRYALDDSADNPRFVETIPRRGYRFITPVSKEDEIRPSQPDSNPKRWRKGTLISAGFVVLLVLGLAVGAERWHWFRKAGPSPEIRSVAVLPIVNLSRDPEQEYFADGMTEALITELAQIRALRVISRTSAMQYKNGGKSLPQIARELDVDAVVEGSVQRDGSRVGVNVQLIHAPTDQHLWAKSYDRDLRDVLSLERDIANSIAKEIRIQVTAHERVRPADDRQVDPAAHEAYLKGRYFLTQYRSRQSLEKSLQLFQQAAQIDPNYAAAYAGSAEAYTTLAGSTGVNPSEMYPKARTSAVKALQLDDTLADAHASLGVVMLYHDWDWKAAEKELQRAIELSPGSAGAHHYYAHLLSSLGRHEQAITEMKYARQLDPVSARISVCVGQVLYEARKYDEAAEDLKASLELFPDDSRLHESLGFALIAKSSYDEGIAEVRKGYELLDSKGPRPRLALALARAGKKSEAAGILKKLGSDLVSSDFTPAELASLYASLGQKKDAFLWLERAYTERAPALAYLAIDPGWDSLRSDPHFQELLVRMKLSG